MNLNIIKINKFITFLLLFYYQFSNYTNSGLGIWNPSVLMSTLIVGLLIIHIIVTVFLYNKNTLPLKYLVLFLLPYAALMGMMNGADRSAMVFDLNIGCLLLLGICLTGFEDKEILKLLIILAVPSCLLSVFELSRTDASTINTLVATREGLWEQPVFFCATFFWLMVALLISSFIFKRNYFLAILCVILNAAINLISTKRLFIVEIAWMLLVLMFVLTRINGRAKNLLPLIIALAFVIGFSSYFLSRSSIDVNMWSEKQTSRFEEDDLESSGFIRFRESQRAFAKSPVVITMIGHGFGVPHHGISDFSNTHSLHIGITNIIYQFGLWLVIPYLIMLFRTLKEWRNVRWMYNIDKWRLVSLLVVIVQTPVFFFVGNYWTITPSVTFFWYFLCRSLITKKDNNDWENEKLFFKPAKATR